MKKNRLHTVTRVLTAACGLFLILIIFVPLWRIELVAPQYPEGLEMFIHANKVSGNVDIINGLNHYIGMREIHEKDFIEFAILPTIFILFSVFAILTTLINRKWFFYTWAGAFIVFSILAIFDFYQWLYNYGHNLDPAAPIKVPGMTYQPPLLGSKDLLNFTAFSIPDIGGWIMAGVAAVITFSTYLEVKVPQKQLIS